MPDASILCRAAFSTAADLETALDEACDALSLDAPDLLVAFVAGHLDACDALPERVSRRIRPRHLVGCTAQGVVGNGEEADGRSGVALFAARLPRAAVAPFHVVTRRGVEGFSYEGLPDLDRASAVLLLPDPFSTPVDRLLEALGPETLAVGGVASAAGEPQRNRLFVDAAVHRYGCVGVVLRGVRVLPAVSQGCRPVGRPFVVTKAEDNVVQTLAGQPALARLQEVLEALPVRDRELAQRGLHVGVVVDEYKERHLHGDFLIRNVMGADPRSGAIAVTDRVRVGQTIQFQVRDAASARGDFETILRRASDRGAPRGALLFSCNGRGPHLFESTGVDAGLVQAGIGPLPVAGFLAAGEIGPVGGANHLHGFTASVAIFCE